MKPAESIRYDSVGAAKDIEDLGERLNQNAGR